MQMVRNFKSAKIQLTLTNSEHPRALNILLTTLLRMSLMSK